MKKTVTVSVTEASRNFAECINRAHYQKTTFVLLKNGEPVARIVPENQKVCTGRDLAKALGEGKVKLTENEARDWRADIAASLKALSPPEDKWR